MRMLTTLTLLLLTSLAHAQSLSPIKIHFFEALAPKDTTSSERFQKEYEGAIATAKALSNQKLSKCGYKIEEKTRFYNASDPLEALESGKASASDAWLIVGPRRSNHYVLLAKGAPDTPSVSTMASSQEVADLGALHLTMAPFNKEMAEVAATEAKARSGGKKTYVSVTSEDCVTCVDFAAHFDRASGKLGLKKEVEFKITGESPDLSEITKAIAKLKPAFVLLPNYSKVTAQAIAAFHKAAPSAFYVGGDGWGDSNFGFLQNAKDLEGAEGFTVRGNPSSDEALSRFPLGRQLMASSDPSLMKPNSGTALAIIKIIDGTSDFLCKYKPKDKASFVTAYRKHANKTFHSPWGVSIYNLKSGNIAFGRIARDK